MSTRREIRRRPIAVGPAEGTAAPSGARAPRFDDDPATWLDWLDAALADGRPIGEAAHPAAWVDAGGSSWRVLVAPEGPEVRPAFGGAFFLDRGLPMISAMLITAERIHVELTWKDGREVVSVNPTEASVRQLGLAMLTATELPHEAIGRIGSETWQRAADRWREVASAAPQDGAERSSSAPDAAGETQARAPWPVPDR